MLITQEDLLSLSSSISRMLKRGFGKGPETCYSIHKGNKLYVNIRNFMTPAEEILIKNNEMVLLSRFRSTVISSLYESLLEETSAILNQNFDSILHDWNYDTNSGILLFENSKDSYNEEQLEQSFKENLFLLFQKVGAQVHRVPNDYKILKFTQNICAIELSGVMYPLVYLLHEKGKIDLLISHSQEIKEKYMEQKHLFEEMFNRSIEEIFIMWDFKEDKSCLIFYFNKQS